MFELKVRKSCLLWISYTHFKEQKDNRLIYVKKLLSEFGDSDTRKLEEIVTGDDTWIR